MAYDGVERHAALYIEGGPQGGGLGGGYGFGIWGEFRRRCYRFGI